MLHMASNLIAQAIAFRKYVSKNLRKLLQRGGSSN